MKERELNLCYFLLSDCCIFKTSSVESYPTRLDYLTLLLLVVLYQPLGFHSNPLTVLAPSSLHSLQLVSSRSLGGFSVCVYNTPSMLFVDLSVP